MAYTLADLVTRTQQRVRDTAYDTTEIKNYINETQNDVFNEYRLRFMQDEEDYTLTVGTADLTSGAGLPANFVQALNILVTTSGMESILQFVEPSDLVDLSATGIPDKWYIFGNTINVHPIPTTAITLKLRYYKKPTEITDNAAVPEIPSEFAELLILGAAYRILQVKDNYDQAAILKNKYDEILQKLVSKYSQAQTATPHIIRTNRYGLGKTNF